MEYSKNLTHLINFLCKRTMHNHDFLRGVPYDNEIIDFIATQKEKNYITVNLDWCVDNCSYSLPWKDCDDSKPKELVESSKISTFKTLHGDIKLATWPQELTHENERQRFFMSQDSYLRDIEEIQSQAKMFHKQFDYDVLQPIYFKGEMSDFGKKGLNYFDKPTFEDRDSVHSGFSVADIFRPIYFDKRNQCIPSDKTIEHYRTLDLLFKIPSQEIRYRKNGGFAKIKMNDYFIRWNTGGSFWIYELIQDNRGRDILTRAYHPHVTNGSYCAGGWSQEWLNNDRKGRAFSVASGFAQFLRRYNSASPYTPAYDFRLDFNRNLEKDEYYSHQGKEIDKHSYIFKTSRTARNFRKLGGYKRYELMRYCFLNNVDVERAMYFNAFMTILSIYKYNHSNAQACIQMKILSASSHSNVVDGIKDRYLYQTHELTKKRTIALLLKELEKPFQDIHENHPMTHEPYASPPYVGVHKLLRTHYPTQYNRYRVMRNKLKAIEQKADYNHFEISHIINMCKTRKSDDLIFKYAMSANNADISIEKIHQLCKAVSRCSSSLKLYLRRSINKEFSILIKKGKNEIKNLKTYDAQDSILLEKIPF